MLQAAYRELPQVKVTIKGYHNMFTKWLKLNCDRLLLEVVGWRSAQLKNSLETFSTVAYTRPKIRFVKEIYGYYRSKAYVTNVGPDEHGEHNVPSRRVKQFMRPILS